MISKPLLKKVWRVGIVFFRGDRKRKAYLLLSLVLLLCAVCAGMFVVISYIQRDLSTAVSRKDVPGFHKAIKKFVGIIIVATPLFAFYHYFQALLEIEWRVWLTDILLSSYFKNRAYFQLKTEGKLDNPDQRICEDVANFVQNAVSIIAIVASKCLNIFAFTGVLWTISPQLVCFLFTYSLVGTFVTIRIFGKQIMHLKFQSLQKEADFRYSLVRVRDNAECIAFYRGEVHESLSVKTFLSSLVVNIRELITWDRHLALFSNAYEFSIIIVPFLFIAPKYFAGQVEFGVISQTTFAFHKILASLSFIILKFDRFSGLAAQTERLDSLFLALGNHNKDLRLIGSFKRQPSSKYKQHCDEDGEESHVLLELVKHVSTTTISREEGEGLTIKDLTLMTPNMQMQLFANLSLSLNNGRSLLVLGPSGCGKSSLMRAIAGLWNTGTGMIRTPAQQHALFLPQKPYMPRGTLRQQLHFPNGEDDDVEVLRTLEEVSLGDLAQRVGGLDAVCEWSDVLSVGEQQRVAFGRLLLRRPEIAFLDEASSALDTSNESLLYSLVMEKIKCYVSVGHRSSLVKYHSDVLEFVDGFGWRWYNRKEFEDLQH